jgi:uncharacterized protein (TIGR03086 family)
VQSDLGDDVNGAAALQLSGQSFRQLLDHVERDDWTRPTPCDGWSVRDLVNHVIGGNFRYLTILGGDPADGIVPTHDEDGFGADPLGSFDDGLARVTQAFSAPGILRAAVRHPKLGAMTGADLRLLRVNELTVHGWDLARAVGSDDRMDEGIVLWLLQRLESLLAAAGLDRVGAADDLTAASPQTRLLSLLGRAGSHGSP